MCDHERLSIIETGSCSTSHERESNGEWSHNFVPGAYNVMVDVFCLHCGLSGKYSKRNPPKWLKERLEEIGVY